MASYKSLYPLHLNIRAVLRHKEYQLLQEFLMVGVLNSASYINLAIF